jgi:hypothetical protein
VSADDHGPVPPGFSTNPTSYRKRVLLAVLAFIGLLDASYLTLYQWDAWPVWDPFFDSTTVLDFTHPVPDALAGVAAYGMELVLLALGGRDRWQRLPWACLALGAVLSIGAVVSVGLIIVQPTIVGAWCTLCLLSAAISLALFFLGIDEGRAAWQHVRRELARGTALGDAVWGRYRAADLATARREADAPSEARERLRAR